MSLASLYMPLLELNCIKETLSCVDEFFWGGGGAEDPPCRRTLMRSNGKRMKLVPSEAIIPIAELAFGLRLAAFLSLCCEDAIVFAATERTISTINSVPPFFRLICTTIREELI